MTFLQKLNSRKLIVTILLGALTLFGIEIPVEMWGLSGAYVVGQSIVDALKGLRS